MLINILLWGLTTALIVTNIVGKLIALFPHQPGSGRGSFLLLRRLPLHPCRVHCKRAFYNRIRCQGRQESRQWRMNRRTDLRTQRDAAQEAAGKAVANSAVHRVERDIALDVAEGTATERDVALAQRNRLAAERSALVGQRDAAFQHAAVEEGRGAEQRDRLLCAARCRRTGADYRRRRLPQPTQSTTVCRCRAAAPIVAAPTPAAPPAVLTPAPASSSPPVAASPPPVAVSSPPPVVATPPDASAAPTAPAAPAAPVSPAAPPADNGSSNGDSSSTRQSHGDSTWWFGRGPHRQQRLRPDTAHCPNSAYRTDIAWQSRESAFDVERVMPSAITRRFAAPLMPSSAPLASSSPRAPFENGVGRLTLPPKQCGPREKRVKNKVQ